MGVLGKFKVDSCVNDQMSYYNALTISEKDNNIAHCSATFSNSGKTYILSLRHSKQVKDGLVCISGPMRKFFNTKINDDVIIEEFQLKTEHRLSHVTMSVKPVNKIKEEFTINTDDLLFLLAEQFNGLIYFVDLPVLINFNGKPILLTVKSLKGGNEENEVNYGQFTANTITLFEPCAETPLLRLKGRHQSSKVPVKAVIDSDWDLNKMGIGGLSDQFEKIFKRAFVSRLYPSDVCDILSMKHTRGILLYGPPGTGKTALARTIAKMLNARAVKVVNGPELLSKYVGESESNMRKIFAEAVLEQEKLGSESALHVIIFDEIDAICKERGTVSGSAGVMDSLVNQLLTVLDGVNQLNNILIVGMTNRKDLIDPALLRPSRLGVHIEIGLPDEAGRRQIFDIYLEGLRKNKKLASDIKMDELVSKSENFTGAEIEGIIQSAITQAMSRNVHLTKTDNQAALDQLMVTMEDIRYSFQQPDLQPAFGSSYLICSRFIQHPIIHWTDEIDDIIKSGAMAAKACVAENNRGYTNWMILSGIPGSGKTALAAKIALSAGFTFTRVLRSSRLVGNSDSWKCEHIRKMFNDARRCPLSCIIIDEVELIIEYIANGIRFSNPIMQMIMSMATEIPEKNNRLLLIMTTSFIEGLKSLNFTVKATKIVNVPSIDNATSLIAVISTLDVFTKHQLSQIESYFSKNSIYIGIKHAIEVALYCVQVESDERVLFYCNDIDRKSRELINYSNL